MSIPISRTLEVSACGQDTEASTVELRGPGVALSIRFDHGAEPEGFPWLLPGGGRFVRIDGPEFEMTLTRKEATDDRQA